MEQLQSDFDCQFGLTSGDAESLFHRLERKAPRSPSPLCLRVPEVLRNGKRKEHFSHFAQVVELSKILWPQKVPEFFAPITMAGFLLHPYLWAFSSNAKLDLPQGMDPSVKIGTIQRRLAWPLRKDDTQNREDTPLFLGCVLRNNCLEAIGAAPGAFRCS